MNNEDDGLPTAAYELVKDMGEDGEATFYYGYDPRTSLSGDIYKGVNPLVRRKDVAELIQDKIKQRERELRIFRKDGKDKTADKSSARLGELKELLEEIQEK